MRSVSQVGGRPRAGLGTFPAGIEVTITGYRSRDGSFTANGQSVKLKDGRNFFMGSAQTPGAEAADAPR
jgi:hypothetical protein